MSNWSTIVANLNAAQLATFGEPITYTPDKGLGDPIATTAILDRSKIDQSTSPGYFGEISIDPLQVTNPARGDQVTWADGVTYTVAKVIRTDNYNLFTAVLHRTSDPS
jgi:hypothetical protein